MTFIAVLGIFMTMICPAVFCCTDGTLGKHTEVQKSKDTQKQLDSQTLVSFNTDFAFSLYKKLALKNPDANIVFSPLCIATSLASLSLGAKGNTLQEILEGLKFNLTETHEADIPQNYSDLLQRLIQTGHQVKISRGNALFVEQHLQILNEFKEKARALYQMEIFTADFQQPEKARKLINDYVKKQSQGKIKEVVWELEKSTFMMILNFLLFTGQWNVPFDPDDTFMGKFILDSRRPVKVLMMKIRDLTIPYFRDEELKCTVIELNYEGDGKAVFILPDQGKMEQVEWLTTRDLEEVGRLSETQDDRRAPPTKVFCVQNLLEDVLPELGIREVFSAGTDLSGITGAKDIRASRMVHDTMLGIAETSTEADATTIVNYSFKSPKINTTFVNIARQFLYMVLEPNSEFISFMGKVINPLEN